MSWFYRSIGSAATDVLPRRRTRAPSQLSSAEIITRYPPERASPSNSEVRRTRRTVDLASRFPVVYLHGVPGGPIGPSGSQRTRTPMAVEVIELSDAGWQRYDFYMRLAVVVESGAKCLG